MNKKFHTLQPWLEEILESIRKDIRTDYLPASTAFYRAHFGNRPQNRLTMGEICAAFTKELLAGNEEMALWVINRWVFKHGDIYRYFEQRLSDIRPDFASIESLTFEESQQIVEGAKASLGVKQIYLFSILNEVVFPETVLDQLRKEALADVEEVLDQEKTQPDLAHTIERLQKEMERLTEKYEQKLAGVLRKYTVDTEGLKKQIRSLQQKLTHNK